MKKFIKFLIVIIILAGIGFGGYYFYNGGYTEMKVDYSQVQLEYFIGEEFSKENIKAKATKLLGGEEDVSDKIAVNTSNFDNTKIGEYNIEITFKNISVDYTVYVVSEKITNVSVVYPYGIEQRIQYLKGENFFVYGFNPILSVQTELNGSISTREFIPTIDTSQYKQHICGNYSVGLSYTANGKIYSTTVNTQVVENITHPGFIYERTKNCISNIDINDLQYKITTGDYLDSEYPISTFSEELIFSRNNNNIEFYINYQQKLDDYNTYTTEFWFNGTTDDGYLYYNAPFDEYDEIATPYNYACFGLLEACYLNPMHLDMILSITLNNNKELVSEANDVFVEDTILYNLSLVKNNAGNSLFTCTGGEGENAITLTIEFNNSNILKINDYSIDFNTTDSIPTIPTN